MDAKEGTLSTDDPESEAGYYDEVHAGASAEGGDWGCLGGALLRSDEAPLAEGARKHFGGGLGLYATMS